MGIMNDAPGGVVAGGKCPTCGRDRLTRYGRTKAGLQKYRCLSASCGRQFVAGSEHRVDPEQKRVALGLLSNGVPPKTIAKAMPGISRRWLYELRRRIQTL